MYQIKRYKSSWIDLDIFRDVRTATAHICDHLLSKPERKGWQAIVIWKFIRDKKFEQLREQASLLFIKNEKELLKKLKKVWEYILYRRGKEPREELNELQNLYEIYYALIVETLEDSKKYNWLWREKRSGKSKGSRQSEEPFTPYYKAIGLLGILVVFDKDSVKTAMIPGLGRASITAKAQAKLSEEGADWFESRINNPIPRNRPIDKLDRGKKNLNKNYDKYQQTPDLDEIPYKDYTPEELDDLERELKAMVHHHFQQSKKNVIRELKSSLYRMSNEEPDRDFKRAENRYAISLLENLSKEIDWWEYYACD